MGAVAGASVLRVDDSPGELGGARLGARAGDEVAVAQRGDDGLDALLRPSPAVALVDLRLPGRSGTELLAQARRAGSDTRVVPMTGHADVASAALALLEKPLDLEVPLGTVRGAARVGELERLQRKAVDALRAREEPLSLAVAMAEVRAAELDAVAAVAHAASHSLDRRAMLSEPLGAAGTVLEAKAEVLLADDADGWLVEARADGSATIGERVRPGDGVAGAAAQAQAPVFVGALDRWPGSRRAREGRGGLRGGGRCSRRGGSSGCRWRRGPGRSTRARLPVQRLAGVVAVALENASASGRPSSGSRPGSSACLRTSGWRWSGSSPPASPTR